MASQSTGSQERSSSKQRAGNRAEAPSPSGVQAAPDSVYGVVSVLYHALQGAETYGQYIRDAQSGGDDELVQFFEECRANEEERAARAKSLLLERLEESDEDSEDEDEGESEDD